MVILMFFLSLVLAGLLYYVVEVKNSTNAFAEVGLPIIAVCCFMTGCMSIVGLCRASYESLASYNQSITNEISTFKGKVTCDGGDTIVKGSQQIEFTYKNVVYSAPYPIHLVYSPRITHCELGIKPSSDKIVELISAERVGIVQRVQSTLNSSSIPNGTPERQVAFLRKLLNTFIVTTPVQLVEQSGNTSRFSVKLPTENVSTAIKVPEAMPKKPDATPEQLQELLLKNMSGQ